MVADTNKQQFLVNSTRVEMIARKQLNRALFGAEHPFGRYAVAEDYDRITLKYCTIFTGSTTIRVIAQFIYREKSLPISFGALKRIWVMRHGER